MKLKSSSHVCCMLQKRETFYKINPIRLDWRIMSTLVCSPTREFRKRFEQRSKTAIRYENDRFFMNNFRQIHSVLDFSLLYKFEFLENNEKIVDARLCEIPFWECPSPNYFIGLTDRNRVFFASLVNGRLIYTAKLPPLYKYIGLGWSKEGEILFAKGKLRDANGSRNRSGFVLSFFHLNPLCYLYSFCIEEKIFGPVLNVYVAQQCVMVVGLNNVMFFYSLEHILDFSDRLNTYSSVSLPDSIAVDREIQSKPPSLYEVKTANDAIEMGGFPWRCLYRPPNGRDYVIEDVANKMKVEHGKGSLTQLNPGQGIEVNVFFHPDETGKILVASENSVTNYQIVQERDRNVLSECWTSKVFHGLLNDDEATGYTSSGRKLNRNNWMCQDGLQIIDCIDYLNDLDLLCVTVCYETPVPDCYVGGEFYCSRPNDMQWFSKGKLILLNNCTGKLIREILLDEPWNNPCEEHRIELDLNFIIHTIKHGASKYSCHVYSLEECCFVEQAEDENLISAGGRKIGTRRSSRQKKSTSASK